MREKYSCYEYEVIHEKVPVWSRSGEKDKAVNGFVYKIYGEGCYPYDDGVIDSEEWFESKQEARFMAIHHIDLLESGESLND